MLLWTILTLMCCAVCVVMCIPLVRNYEATAKRKSEALVIYQEQLKEAERELAAGVASEREAAATKVEIQRRMLAAARAGGNDNPFSARWKMIALAAITAFLALAAVNLYGLVGQPDVAIRQSSVATSQSPTVPPQGKAPAGSPEQLIEDLKQRLAANPNDGMGWKTLGWSYFNTGKYDLAADAYSRAMEIESGNADLKAAYAEALVQAAGGNVTPKAAAIFAELLKSDPKNPRSRFYLALALEQAGKAKDALDAWSMLYKDAPPDAGWLTDVRSHVEALGKTTGTDVGVLLASKPATSSGADKSTAPVISQDDVNAVKALPEGDQQAMIKGMVERLAERLRSEPNDPDGWKRLMRARTVLGDEVAAKAALNDALKAFSNDLAVRESLLAAAKEYGINQD